MTLMLFDDVKSQHRETLSATEGREIFDDLRQIKSFAGFLRHAFSSVSMGEGYADLCRASDCVWAKQATREA
jgi:hypothetical protein